jgi:predicted phage terminase large subunit-like protein
VNAATGLPAVGAFSEGDKITRVSLQLEKFANCQVFFPKEAPWLVELEDELFSFPNGRFDDQVSSKRWPTSAQSRCGIRPPLGMRALP